ncbi:hypothetical protein F5146DRAFT_1006109 [Armillaria mellea]|nr:hypothetical protein F5146DRAFT_1006109 [Armillaria mellea]
MSTLQKQKRTSATRTSSFILLILETIRPHRVRGFIYENFVCPSLDDKIQDIRSQIEVLEDEEERLAGLDGKDKDTMDSEEVRMMAKRRAFQTNNHYDWHEMEKLHVLRLQLSEQLNAQNTRSLSLVLLRYIRFGRYLFLIVHLELPQQVYHDALLPALNASRDPSAAILTTIHSIPMPCTTTTSLANGTFFARDCERLLECVLNCAHLPLSPTMNPALVLAPILLSMPFNQLCCVPRCLRRGCKKFEDWAHLDRGPMRNIPELVLPDGNVNDDTCREEALFGTFEVNKLFAQEGVTDRTVMTPILMPLLLPASPKPPIPTQG